MSLGSSLSWRTSNNQPSEPNEHVQFLDVEGKRKKQRVFFDLKNNPKQNDRIDLEFAINELCCCKNSLKFLHRLKGLYTWKVPWIAVLLSSVQVCAKYFKIKIKFLSINYLILNLINAKVAIYFVACNDSITLLIFKPQRKNDLWRFITYQFIHFNLTHLLLNVVLQVDSLLCSELFRIFQIKSPPLCTVVRASSEWKRPQ